jgi:hypothetical protein
MKSFKKGLSPTTLLCYIWAQWFLGAILSA